MSHPHDHQHHNHFHGHSHADHGHLNRNKNFGLAFVLNLGLSLFELVGGVWIGSFAVLAGAIHDFGDAISLGLAWYLERIANQRKNELFNFGYRRFSLLSALLAGVIILSGSIIICFHAIKDFGSSHQLNPKMMILFATIGIIVNAVSAWRMSRGKTKNERILTWHLIEDFLIKHKVRSYQTSHTSIVNGDQQFITGALDTNNGKFRISILVRGSVISQFRIENDNG